jgi:uncharacterized RDD family membrane protein YckC
MRFFNRITHRTPESVELEFTLAGIGSRIYALIIDYLVWGLLLIAVLIIWAVVAIWFEGILDEILDDDDIFLWVFAIQILIFFAVYVGYFVFFETLWQGQTPGKRNAKIRVICDDGRPVRLAQATLRSLLRPFDDLFFIGALLIMFGAREKRLGDWVAGTLVIQEETTAKAIALTLSDKAATIAQDLVATADLALLLPEDFATIRNYLQRRGQLLPSAHQTLSRDLANQTKAILQLRQRPPGLTSDEFLEGVYLAYQQSDRPAD